MGTRGGEAARFAEYLERLGEAVGHADRREPLRAYVTGLLLPGERKSVEPMAAKIDPRRVAARHQSMHHFVAAAPWEAQAVVDVARAWVLPQLERHGPVAAWVVDDTGMPKKGRHSVGVARQYCGPLGKPENCQVAVTVSLVNAALSVPAAYRLYLPEVWARDRRRRRSAYVPPSVRFAPKWTLALAEVDRRPPARRRRAPGPGGGRCGLRACRCVPGRSHRARPLLRRGRAAGYRRLAAGAGAGGAGTVVWVGAASTAAAAHRPPAAARRRGARDAAPGERVGAGTVARGDTRPDGVVLCGRPRPAGAPG
jgi:hypothetical protein